MCLNLCLNRPLNLESERSKVSRRSLYNFYQRRRVNKNDPRWRIEFENSWSARAFSRVILNRPPPFQTQFSLEMKSSRGRGKRKTAKYCRNQTIFESSTEKSDRFRSRFFPRARRRKETKGGKIIRAARRNQVSASSNWTGELGMICESSTC